jgi:hypothetical protein
MDSNHINVLYISRLLELDFQLEDSKVAVRAVIFGVDNLLELHAFE